MAIGCLLHESTLKSYPGGGWGPYWVGDADCGLGKMQPGGWLYRILPFIEAQNVYQEGAGASGTAKFQAHGRRYQIAVPVLNCPTRRSGVIALDPDFLFLSNNLQFAAGTPQVSQRSDYAANLGTGPDSLQILSYGPWKAGSKEPTTAGQISAPNECAGLRAADYQFPAEEVTHPLNASIVSRRWDGISYNGSEIRPKQVTDGTSNTYLVGEKHVDPESYLGLHDWGDDWGIYTGQQDDIMRLANIPPHQDTIGGRLDPYYVNAFGSAHVGGLHMAFCDGSVHFIDYNIDAVTHLNLGRRNDGEAVALSDL